MKKFKNITHISTSIICLLCIIFLSFPVNARTFSPSNETRSITFGPTYIQRVYNGASLVFTYTHDITYHFDPAHVYTDRVEHNTNASQFGTNLAASKGINVSSYTPYGASGAWSLVGWKLNDGSANTTNVNNNIASQGNYDLYAVWAKDCTSFFNFNSGGCTAWNSFGTDWYARGSAYYNNGSITPFTVRLPNVARADYTLTSITNNGSGSYAQGGTYNLTDPASFLCNWKRNCASGTFSYSFTGNSNQIWAVGITNQKVAAGSTITVTLTSSGSSHASDLAYMPHEYRGEITVFGETHGLAPGQVMVQNWQSSTRIYNDMCENPPAQWTAINSMTRSFVTGADRSGLVVAVHNRGQGSTGPGENSSWSVSVTITPP